MSWLFLLLNILVLVGTSLSRRTWTTCLASEIEIIHLLEQYGTKVTYSGPIVAKFPKIREYHFGLTSVAPADLDCVLLAIDHDGFDYELIKQNAVLLVDTRGPYRQSQVNVVKA